MNESFTLKSTSSNREICFSKYDGENFFVEVKGNITASIKVYGYSPHSFNLAHWFCILGEYSGAWESVETWESLEGEFKITATCTPLGQVFFTTSLKLLTGSDEEAFIKVTLNTELGQIKKITDEAGKFFEKRNT